MGTLAITNPSSTDTVHLGDFNYTLAESGTLTRTLTQPEFQKMSRLQALIAAETVTAVYTPSADEEASGALTPPLAVEDEDIARVAAAAVPGVPITFRKAFVATGAPADDVTIFDVNKLPYKFRILSMHHYVSTGVGAPSTHTLRTRAGGAGTALASFDANLAGGGLSDLQGNATTVVTPAALEGLFLRRADGISVGELLITIRRES